MTALPYPAARRLWSLPQRLIHWGLVLALALAWWSASRYDDLHAWCGYAVAALVMARIVLGFGRHPTARWSEIWMALLELPRFLRAWVRHQKPAHTTRHATRHTTLSAAVSIILLLALSLALAVSGWMQTLDAYAGEDWLEELHHTLFNVLLAWVVLHIVVVLALSIKERHNRIVAMISGGRLLDERGDKPQ